ncbi:DUF423 domain-containing protein [Undibacterium sp. LFS511W]|uniref:DUF423 domain-containing protein n=2 Tax=Undibacterium luofuense TaxID=2828733 RepID=A0A941I6U3_9BURK|nr:DUF423 domain-containing protein [Undibacterium luofuense]
MLIAGALAMLIAVATGAFGAHALKKMLDAEMLAIWQTAVHYQMVHALGLMGIGILQIQKPDWHLAMPALLMLTGILIFSGSLYLLALSGVRWLGAVTPFGGVAFLLAWGWLAQLVWRQRNAV